MEITLFIVDIVKNIKIHEADAACVPSVGERVGGWDGFIYEVTGVRHALRGGCHIATLYVRNERITE